MILNVEKIPSLNDDFVHIKYRELTPTIKSVITLCKGESGWLPCYDNGCVHNIDINDIYYIEWVDNKCCICTKDNVYTSSMSLSKIENSLSEYSFVRISKAVIVNVYKVRWISSGLNMKLIAELTNGEKVVINRHYRPNLLSAISAISKEKRI